MQRLRGYKIILRFEGDVNRMIGKRGRLLAGILGIVLTVLMTGYFCFAGEDDYIFSETEDKIYNTLLAAGYSKAGACGILGNIAVENPKFEADLYANNGTTYGLFQWNNVGDRKDNLVKWCNNRKLYSQRPDGQIAFAMYELEGGDSIAKRANDFLKTTENPRNAAMEFAVGFERCIGSTSNSENDAEYEGFIYPERFGRTYQAMARRMDMAEKYFNGYEATTADMDLVYKIGITPTPGMISEIEDKIRIEIGRSIDFNVDFTGPEEEKPSVAIPRLICITVGYLCGCVYLSLLFVDRKKLKMSRGEKIKEIPHGSSVFAQVGPKKAAIFFINDILKLLIAIAITTVFVKGLTLDDITIFTGLGVIIGNAYPFWNRFRGGIGLTVTILLLMVYMPIWGVLCCLIGVYFAVVLQSLTIGVIIMSSLMVPFVYNYKDTTSAGVIAIIMALLIISHQRILFRYFDRKVLRAHYANRRESFRATSQNRRVSPT